MRHKLILSLLVLAASVVLAGQALPPAAPARSRQAAVTPGRSTFALTVESIMRGPKLVGSPPTGLRWSGDSMEVYFEWRKPGEDEASTYVVGREAGTPRKLTDEERRKAPPVGGSWDAAHRRVLFVDGGDVVIVDTVARMRQQVTRTTAAEANARWARSETAITFTRDNNLFLMPLATGAIEQVTDVQPAKPEPRDTDSQKALKAEEQALIQYTREQVEKKKRDEEKRKKEALPLFEIRDRQTVPDLALSPDGVHVFLIVVDRAQGAKTADVPNYVTESGYTENIAARPFVGDAQDRRRLAILDLKTGKSVWADAGFAGKRKTAEATPGTASKEGEIDREVQWNMPLMSRDGKVAVASVRSADNKDRWLVVVDPGTGKSRVVDALHDDAWVEGFGGQPMRPGPTMGFMPDDRRIWFLSERDGWMHLYAVDAAEDGARPTPLTSGRFEVSSVSVSQDKKSLHFVSSERHLGERHMYSMPVDGGPRTQITTMTGSSIGEVSPDGTTVAFIYSYTNKPPEICVGPSTPGAKATQVTTTPIEEWRSFKWADPQVLAFKARDGADVYARLFTPEMMGAKRDPSAPGVVFVHGGGYVQNAHKYWSNYYREYMFHNLLASKGYVVLDVDYRASLGYGRDWRAAIYRHMGGKDLDDIVDGAKFLVEKQKVNPKRIGVYGGSYGGFMTLMVMFTSPDTFAAGAALRPVTDWAHYNHTYSGAILNQPQDDPGAYRQSSPIYFADRLKGALLICHGMVDTNVHFQDSVRLVQRLIELRKDNWELAVYPVENHGFEQETSWVDEYKRILKLFETELRLKPVSRTTS